MLCAEVGLTAGGSQDWTSFLSLPVSTRSYRQGTGNGERVYDSGNLLVQLFLDCELF